MKKYYSVVTLLLISVLVASAILDIADAISPTPTPAPGEGGGYCVSKCGWRCSRNPRNLCKKLCMACCSKCKCVPSGPFADKSQCPCYRDIKNSKGQSKCP